jgi:hypothetical protein
LSGAQAVEKHIGQYSAHVIVSGAGYCLIFGHFSPLEQMGFETTVRYEARNDSSSDRGNGVAIARTKCVPWYTSESPSGPKLC